MKGNNPKIYVKQIKAISPNKRCVLVNDAKDGFGELWVDVETIDILDTEAPK